MGTTGQTKAGAPSPLSRRRQAPRRPLADDGRRPVARRQTKGGNPVREGCPALTPPARAGAVRVERRPALRTRAPAFVSPVRGCARKTTSEGICGSRASLKRRP